MAYSNISSGQAGIPEQCTICEHQPLSPDVCTPMKSLRMTIKAHLKTELKRRTAQASAASATPVTAAPTPTPAEAEAESAPQETPAPAPAQEEETPQTASEATVEAANNEGAVVTSTEQHDADQGDMLHTNVSFSRDQFTNSRALTDYYYRATLNQMRSTRPKKASMMKTRPIRATWRSSPNDQKPRWSSLKTSNTAQEKALSNSKTKHKTEHKLMANNKDLASTRISRALATWTLAL